MDPILEVKNLSKNFGGVMAVDDFSFCVNKGDTIGLVGDNGAGKSTLIKMISGVLKPNGGEIYWKGQPIKNINPKKMKSIGIETIYQDLSLADNLKISANIFMGRELEKKFLSLVRYLDEAKMLRESIKALENLKIGINIPSYFDPVEKLSGGQRQSIAIAKAIYWEVEMIIMDEPTSSLGVKERKKVIDLINELKKEDVTIIIISHNLLDIIEVTNRVIVMRKGQKVAGLDTKKTTDHELLEHMMGIAK